MLSSTATSNVDHYSPTDRFVRRHIGPSDEQIEVMLTSLGFSSLEELTKSTVPPSILHDTLTALPQDRAETETLNWLKEIASKNKVEFEYLT